MANKALDTQLVDRAILFATNAHAGTERRGKGFPYIVHPLEAMSIVATITKDPELLAAAVLHDTVEDTSVTIEDIRREFGDRVAGLVEAESDSFLKGVSEEDSWHDRKQSAITRLANAPYDAKVVAIGDKLSNLRAIWRDYFEKGDELWKIFHAKDRADHEWHYRGLMYAMRELAGTYAYSEYCMLIYDIFGEEGKIETIDLGNYRQSGDGYTAVSYDRLDDRTVVKLYEENVPVDVPEKELNLSRKVESLGIKTPHPIRIVTDGKRFGNEFEKVRGKRSFCRAISQDATKLEYYTVRFAKLAKKLHSTYCDTSAFPCIKDILRDDINSSDAFDVDLKRKMLDFIDTVPDAQTCIHGDLHIGNILTNGLDEYWIDLGDFSYGYPLFDLGMFYFVCHMCPDSMSERLFHLSSMQMSIVWSIFVKAYFGAAKTEDLMRANAKVEPFAALAVVHLGRRNQLEEPLISFVKRIFA